MFRAREVFAVLRRLQKLRNNSGGQIENRPIEFRRANGEQYQKSFAGGIGNMKNQNFFTLPGVEKDHAQNNFNSRRELLESSKLSRLPQRKPFRIPTFDNTPSKATVSAVCAGCDGKLDLTDSIQQRFNSCRKCVGIYGRVDAAREEIEKSERRQLLEKFVGGAK